MMIRQTGMIGLVVIVVAVAVALFIVDAPIAVNWKANTDAVIAQPGIQFVDSDDIAWTLADDTGNTRVTLTADLANTMYPGLLLGLAANGGSWQAITMPDINVSASTGTGSGTANLRNLEAGTGATAGSTHTRRSGGGAKGWSLGTHLQKLNWSKQVAMSSRITVDVNTTNGIGYFVFGRPVGTTVGSLTGKGIAIRTEGLALKGATHDGSTETIVDLGVTLTLDEPYQVLILSDGTGAVTWYSVTYPSGAYTLTSLGTTSAGPTGLGLTGYNLPGQDVQNGADAADYQTITHTWNIYVAQ